MKRPEVITKEYLDQNPELVFVFGDNTDRVGMGGASLFSATHNSKELWSLRPVMQLGCCGSADRTTLVMFYADKSEPMVYCGCFSGTIDEFEKKIHHKHAGTLCEHEYMAMVEHIRAKSVNEALEKFQRGEQ